MTMAEHKNQDVLNQFMCGYRSVAKRFAALAEETGSCWRTTKTSSAHAFLAPALHGNIKNQAMAARLSKLIFLRPVPFSAITRRNNAPTQHGLHYCGLPVLACCFRRTGVQTAGQPHGTRLGKLPASG